MSKFQQFWWYIGVAMTSVGLLMSVLSGNWILACVCALVTAGLKKLQPNIDIPNVYKERGIKNSMFTPGGKR